MLIIRGTDKFRFSIVLRKKALTDETSENKRSKLEKEYEIRMTKEFDEVVDEMCNISGYYTERYDDAIAEIAEKNEVIAAKDEELEKKNRIIAEMMINNGKPADEIEGYTGLNINTLKQIAKSLGKSLVL